MTSRLIASAALACAGATVALAADRPLVIKDYTGRGFAPDTVTYTITGAKAKKLRLFDAAGQALPLQAAETGKGQLAVTFVTDLPADATREFVLRDDGKGTAPATAVAVTRDSEMQVLTNGQLSVRVPRVQEREFKDPVAANTLPAPLLGFQTQGGAWRGGGKMLSPRPVSAFRVTLAGAGPVFCEVRYDLTFAGGGFYRATVRVEHQVPLVKISEEYDPGVMDGGDAWELDLASGWQPANMEIASTAGNGAVDVGHVEPLANLTKKPSWYIVPDNAWGPLSQLGLTQPAAPGANPAVPLMAGIVPLHKGDWRHMNGIEIQSTGPQDVRARFPMSRRNASWLREVTSETSPFSMQEHEPGQSVTYGRRHWGLVLAPPAMTCKAESDRECGPFYQARLFYGVVGLDRYKDFILDWPDTGAKYPRLYLHADTLDAYKRNLEAAPFSAEFKSKLKAGTIALGADEKTAAKKAADMSKRLGSIARNVFMSPTTGHHWTAPQYTTAAAADDVLGWPGLTPAVRAELRTRIALICHLWQEPDILGYGDGSHTGNPNMGTARFSPMVSFLPLVPDHPRFAAWRHHMAAFLEYKASEQTVPGGGYFEYGAAYHMHGFARVMNVLPALQDAGATGLEHLFAIERANWAYYMNLLTPVDSRWKFRVIPGMANSPPGYTEHLLEAAAELAGREPALAANLAWAWNANGANDRGDPVWSLNGQLAAGAPAPREPALKSVIYPGVGVIFRAHQGADETYLFLRSGFNWSHWNEDQGHMVLLSRGATLLPFQPYQYWNVGNKEFEDHNLLRFGHPENRFPHAWPDSNVLDYAFGERVDYAWSSTGFPDWYILPGSTPEFGGKVDAPVGTGSARRLADGSQQQQGAFQWDRQVLFLKGKTGASPNYFVVRDSTRGAGRLASWLCLNLLGVKEDFKTDGTSVLVDTEWPVKLDLRFAQAQPVKPEFYEENQYVALAGYSGPSWWRLPGPVSKNWVKKDGTPQPPDAKGDFWEKHCMVRIAAQPDSGYFWVMYPRTAAESAPVVSSPAAGVLKIEQPEGTDYAFVSSTPLTYEADGVQFAGCAGAVRIGKDGNVTLALTGGTGRVGYRGFVVAGTAPLERTVAVAALKPGEEKVASAVSAIKMGVAVDEARAEQLAPGVKRIVTGGDQQYFVVDSAAPVSFAEGDVRLEVGRAQIERSTGKVRFIVPDASYARLSVGNVGVRGLGPFDLTFTRTGISGKVEGRARSLVCTWPDGVVRPMFHMDGQRWYAGWADDHSISKGTKAPQFALAFGVTDGAHTVEIGEWMYPELPVAPLRTAVAF